MMSRKSVMHHVGNALYRVAQKIVPGIYAQDGLLSVHAHDFMADPSFKRAYARGVKALGGTDDYRWHWRIHVGLWAASCSSRLEGDFVECGVNRGFLSSAIMEHLDWNSMTKTFYLLDTFGGLDERVVSDREREAGALARNRRNLENGFYVSGADDVIANFAEWKRVRIIQGTIPDTLPDVDARRIAYLHIDMNCAPPEVAAAEYFWDRLVPGGLMLLDDYAYWGYGEQKSAMDAFAARKAVAICALPTGQGLLIKPPAAPASDASPGPGIVASLAHE